MPSKTNRVRVTTRITHADFKILNDIAAHQSTSISWILHSLIRRECYDITEAHNAAKKATSPFP